MTTRQIRYIAITLAASGFVFAASVYAQGDSSRGRVLSRGLSDTHAENLKNLNSGADDATPIVTSDEGTLYFTSYRNNGKQVIYRSKRKSPDGTAPMTASSAWA